MARHVLSRSSTTPNRAVDARNGDSVVQRSGVITTVTGDSGIVGAGNNKITLNGSLIASLDGVSISGQSRNGTPDYRSGHTSTVTLNSRALIEAGSIGVSVSFDTLKLTNNGVIEARSGIQAYETANSEIINTGTIRSNGATDYGTGITVASGTNTSIVNSGTIDFAGLTGIYIYNTKVDGWDRADVTNTGTISGFVVVGTQDGEVINSGQIDGTVISANVVNSGVVNGDIRLENDNGSYQGAGDVNGSISSTFSGGMTIKLDGDLVSSTSGISIPGGEPLSDTGGSGMTTNVSIGAQGSIRAQDMGVNVNYDTLKLTNNGLIEARSGIQAYQTANSEIINTGTIRSIGATDYGTGITVASGTNTSIVNSGTIDFSGLTGIYIYNTKVDGWDRADVTNTGTISGYVVVGTQDGEVINSGRIDGTVISANVVNSGVVNGDIRLENDNGSYQGSGDVNGSISSTFSGGMTIKLDGDLVSSTSGISIPGGEQLSDTGGSGMTTKVSIGADSTLSSQDRALSVNFDTLLFTNDGDISSGTGLVVYSTENSEIVNNGSIVRNGALEYGTGITVVNGTNNHIVNNGIIDFGDQTGIYIGQSDNGNRPDVTNNGTVTGWVVVGTPEGEVANTGRITGNVLAAQTLNSGMIDGTVDGTSLINSGTVTGDIKAEHVVNSGCAQSVQLRLQAAAGGYYDGRNGTVASVTGSDGNDTILGGAGKEVLDGGAGNDLINGGRYHDVLTGGTGKDVFQFDKISGYDTITDFDNGLDRIDLTALGIKSYNSLLKAISSDADGDATIDFSDLNGSYRGVITLDGVSISELDRSDFIF
jgi:hypothetical protein